MGGDCAAAAAHSRGCATQFAGPFAGRLALPWALAAALLVASGLTAVPAWAQPDEVPPDQLPDYDTGNQGWNGLNTLTAVARGLGLKVQAVATVDWEELDQNDVLLLLYPENRLDPGHVASFIRTGGNLLLADDFGDSSEVLGRLGMLRERATGVNATRFYRELDYVPMAVPVASAHPLSADVSELATNVPGVLVQVRGAEVIFEFGPGEAVVASGALGNGQFVVVSDPSIFINRMLQFEGNMQFAINALRYLGRDGQAERLLILAGDFDIYGQPAPVTGTGSVNDTIASLTIDINRLLDEGNDYLLTHTALKVLGFVVAALIGALALMVLPSLRQAPLDGSWTQANAASALLAHGFEDIVNRYEREQRTTNFALPGAVMRDTVNECLARALNSADPLYNLNERELIGAVHDCCGAAPAAALQHVYKPLKRLPSRLQAASVWGAGYLSRRDFQRLHDDVDRLFQALGEPPDIS